MMNCQAAATQISGGRRVMTVCTWLSVWQRTGQQLEASLPPSQPPSPCRFAAAALIAQVKMAAHAATKFPEEEKQSCGRAGEAPAVSGGTRRRAPSTKLSSCRPFGVYLKRSVREMALIPLSLLLRRRHPFFKIKNSPNRARVEERRGGRKKKVATSG